MQILKALISVGVTREKLAAIDGDEIIRIEKKLTAESRLNGQFTKNDIARITDLLKSYPDVLYWLCTYQCLYGILVGIDAEKLDNLQTHPIGESERIRQAISTYFYDDAITYINLNFIASNWNNVRVLMHYKKLLPLNIQSIVFQRLQSKVSIGFDNLKSPVNQSELTANYKFLADKEFFMLLSDVNVKYFERYVYGIADYLKKNRSRFSNKFVGQMVSAMRTFDSTNLQLDNFLLSIINDVLKSIRETRKTWIPNTGIIILIISLFRLCSYYATTKHSVTNHADDPYGNQLGVYGGNSTDAKLMDSVRKGMARFVEARSYALSYPLNSWKVERIMPAKYKNPFNTDIFQANCIGLRHNLNSLNIFNSTGKECVVIAYYNEYYDVYDKQYVNKQEGYPPYMYAIYIPPGDSIKVDLKMWLLRFYMGHNLRGFNTYRNKKYQDSADVKFSKFTPADSVLFSYPFTFNGKKKDTQSIIISQPSQLSYQLQWQGDGELNPFTLNGNSYIANPQYGATDHNPLVLKSKFTSNFVLPRFETFLNQE